MHGKCNAFTKAGKPCKGRLLPDRLYCMSHDPEHADLRAEGQRKGGEARANARRAARQWAAVGEQLSAADLPAILRACMFSVRAGALEPAQASAIATLAKTSITITAEIELEQRIAALERVIGVNHPGANIRRIS
jgi:hypothetical protein